MKHHKVMKFQYGAIEAEIFQDYVTQRDCVTVRNDDGVHVHLAYDQIGKTADALHKAGMGQDVAEYIDTSTNKQALFVNSPRSGWVHLGAIGSQDITFSVPFALVLEQALRLLQNAYRVNHLWETL